MAMLRFVSCVVALQITGILCLSELVTTRITGDWWNPCGPHEDYDLCPRYQCVSETCLHFLGLMKCEDRGNNMPCRAECRCMKFFYRNRRGKCIPQHECVQMICGKNEIFKRCHPCNYADKSINCPNADPLCKPGCYCKSGFVRDVFGECVDNNKTIHDSVIHTWEEANMIPTPSSKTRSHQEDNYNETYKMLVLPRPDSFDIETDNASFSIPPGQTSFKILPIDLQFQIHKKGKLKPSFFKKNNMTYIFTKMTNSTKTTTPINIYKYFGATDQNYNSVTDGQFTTITINTIQDNNDIKITKSFQKTNETNFYKYISVSLMDDFNRTKINSTKTQDFNFDTTDIHVPTTTTKIYNIKSSFNKTNSFDIKFSFVNSTSTETSNYISNIISTVQFHDIPKKYTYSDNPNNFTTPFLSHKVDMVAPDFNRASTLPDLETSTVSLDLEEFLNKNSTTTPTITKSNKTQVSKETTTEFIGRSNVKTKSTEIGLNKFGYVVPTLYNFDNSTSNVSSMVYKPKDFQDVKSTLFFNVRDTVTPPYNNDIIKPINLEPNITDGILTEWNYDSNISLPKDKTNIKIYYQSSNTNHKKKTSKVLNYIW